MLREQIAPRLRSLGFKGSGQVFELPMDDHWALLGFQKSVSSDRDRVRFTINLLVIGKREWEDGRQRDAFWPARPRPNTRWGIGWEDRIGGVVPGSADDLWWTVAADEDAEMLSGAVIWAVTEFALPAMQTRASLRGHS
jgi:hypothetical protein